MGLMARYGRTVPYPGNRSAMSKKTANEQDTRRTRYEYRVWGKQRGPRKKLMRLATHVNDCYLIHDEPGWNVKVRDDTLKLKQLMREDAGFERWTSQRHESAGALPSPFDAVFEQLRLDRPQRGKSYDLRRAVPNIDPESGVRAVFVTKRRETYTVGDLGAEVTDITMCESGDVLQTLAIEGNDLDDLIALRKRLGLRDEPNVAVHEVIEAELLG